jgi:hypothetical protein
MKATHILPAILLTVLAATGTSQGQLIFSDDFDLVDGRTNNSQLNGDAVQTGTGTWAATGDVRLQSFNGERVVYANVSTTGQRAVVPVSFTSGDELTLTWEVRHQGANWLAGGFTDGNQFVGISTNGQIWMNWNGSQVIARANGTSTIIGSYTAGTDFTLSGGDFQTMALIYDSAANTVSGQVNGTTIFSDYNLGAFTPSVSSTILEWNNPANNTGDSFSSVQLTAIPEPSSFALMAAGLISLTIATRRRRRQA